MTEEKELPLFNIKIPKGIISNKDLTDLEKLLLSIDYTLREGKEGYNSYFNTDIAKMLNVHHPQISTARKNLLKSGFYKKEGRKYTLTKHLDSFVGKDDRDLLLVPEVYQMKLDAGAKLLWAEYNSLSKTKGGYFAKREYTAEKLGCSKTSISNWTKKLREKELLELYEIKSGYGSKRRIVRTKTFEQKAKTKEGKKELKVESVGQDKAASLPAKNITRVSTMIPLLIPSKTNFDNEHEVSKVISNLRSNIFFDGMEEEDVYPVLINHLKSKTGKYVSMFVDELKERMNE